VDARFYLDPTREYLLAKKTPPHNGKKSGIWMVLDKKKNSSTSAHRLTSGVV
jgi:hypothetical protein